MLFLKNIRYSLLPVAIAFVLSIFLTHTHYLSTIEHALFDLQTRLSTETVDSNLVLIEIDHKSIKELNNWPWPRSHHALLLENLRKAGAKKIFFDMDFSNPSNRNDDAIFASALAASNPRQIYLPTFLQYSSTQANRYLTLVRPIDLFLKNTKAVSVSLQPEADGRVRQIELLSTFSDLHIPTMASIFSGYTPQLNESMLINFRINPESFNRISYVDIFSNNFHTEEIKDKHIIIGATALELSDQIPVPVYHSLPGPLVQALAYQSIIEGKLTKANDYYHYASLLILLFITWLFLNRKSWRVSFIFTLVIASSGFLFSLLLYTRYNIVFELSPSLFFIFTNFILSQLAHLDNQSIKLIRQSFALKKNEAMMSSVVQNTSEGILTLDIKGTIKSINPSAVDMFKTSTDKIINQPVALFLPMLGTGSNKITYMNSDKAHEATALKEDGSSFPVELRANRLTLPEQDLYTLFIHDITEQKAQKELLEYQATHDCLTELYNRAALVKSIQDAIIDYHQCQTKSALLTIDLNRFKEINDTLGHQTGDAVLKILGDRLNDFNSKQTIVARIGGDEFAVLIRDEKSDESTAILIQQILTAISLPFLSNGISLQLSASIGIARLPDDSELDTELMMFSDIAMYEAKKTRREYCAYNQCNNNFTVRNLSISTQIKQAIDEHQFAMYYQPKVDIKTNKVIGFEALMRWQHPDLGFISPADFIAIAEQSSLIKPLTFYSLEQSLQQLKILHAENHQVSIAVNLSAMLLQDITLADDIAMLLQKHNADTQWLELEITESAIVDDLEHAIIMLNKIRELGISLSIDDFGTGYASLSYLKKLPVQQLKIDKLFVEEIDISKSDRIIIQSTIDLSHDLGLKVVAEGIETESIYRLLNKIGCDTAQGYWISKPLAANGILDWMNSWEQKHRL